MFICGDMELARPRAQRDIVFLSFFGLGFSSKGISPFVVGAVVSEKFRREPRFVGVSTVSSRLFLVDNKGNERGFCAGFKIESAVFSK